MPKDLYMTGEYLEKNPTWHVQDSIWKARQIVRMLKRNALEPRTICEIGCGAGEVLKQLQSSMDSSCTFLGYEISPQAFRLCQERANEKLHFQCKDFLQEEETSFELLLLIDVIEHLEDYFTFLRRVQPRGQYKVLHIPLDLSVQAVMRPGKLRALRQSVGHIHYFTKETALRSLEDAGYQIRDCFLTSVAMDSGSKAFKTRATNALRRLATTVSEGMASRILGGFSLMVLAS